jgi:hypothetical protein
MRIFLDIFKMAHGLNISFEFVLIKASNVIGQYIMACRRHLSTLKVFIRINLLQKSY